MGIYIQYIYNKNCGVSLNLFAGDLGRPRLPCFQRDHPLNLTFKTKLALIGFILWHLWESENQHSLSTVVKCHIFGRCIVNVEKALFGRKILLSLPINILVTNNTNFYRLNFVCVLELRIGHVTPVHGIWMTDYLFICMHNTFNLSYKIVYKSIFYLYKRIYQILTISHLEYWTFRCTKWIEGGS